MSGLQLMSIMDMTDITCCYVLDVGQSTAVIGCVIIPVLGVIKALLATARLPALMHLFIRSFVCLSVCLSVCRQNTKTRFSQKTKQFRAMVSVDDLHEWAFQRTDYWTRKVRDGE